MNPLNVITRIISYFNLDTEILDFDNIHETIRKDIVFKGTNLWILMFAIIVASVGLNMNSTAVIIGAMLISPLMGPINGMGYSIATYDFPLFQQALKNFGFAVLASLMASTSYFFLSPISTAHSELLARTSPTIYDVLIALFGGMAGVIAISSKQKGNVIPGVAIATALMPPLCTAGYGLATFQPEFFLGAFYLFTINTVFIAISSIVVSQVLKFPIRTLVNENQKKKVNRWISVVIIIVAIPSIYFGYNLVKKEKFIENANKYVKNVSAFQGHYLLNHSINADERQITLVYGGVTMQADEKIEIRLKAMDFELDSAYVQINQGLVFEAFDVKNAEIDQLRNQLNYFRDMVDFKNRTIDSLKSRNFIGKEIFLEIKPLYPQITECYYSEPYLFSDSLQINQSMPLIIFKTGLNELEGTDKQKIEAWLLQKLQVPKVKVIYE